MEDKRIQRILDVLKVGKENALHQKDIAEMTGEKPASVKYLIQKARRRLNISIVADTSGYYFPADDTEKESFTHRMEQQAFSRLKTIKAIKGNPNEIEGQIRLSEGEGTGLERQREFYNNKPV